MILFVDDDRRRMDSYVRELELSGHDVHFESDVDDALSFFIREGHKVKLLILDIMMPPGRYFSNESTENGLITGTAFYSEISRYQSNVSTVIFTNVSEENLDKEVTTKDSVVFYQKDSLLPFELEKKVRELLWVSK